MSETAPAGIGHNSMRLADLCQASVLLPDLAERFPHLARRKEELLAGVARFEEACPGEIEDEDTMAKVTDLLAMLAKFAGDSGAVEQARKDEVRPILDAQACIMKFFKALRDPVLAVTPGVRSKATAYTLKIETEKRLAREAEAKRLRDAAIEAERKAMEDAKKFDEAIVVAEQAEVAQKAALAPVRDLTRTRGDMSVGGIAVTYTFEVTNVALLPLEYLMPNTVAIGKAVKANPLVPIPGVRIIENKSFRTYA